MGGLVKVAEMTPHSWHAMDAKAAMEAVRAEAAAGLARDEAARRLAEHGPNTLPEAGRRPMWRVFAGQFANPLIYILFAAAVIAFAMGKRGDAAVILVVVVINAVIGAFQEGRAERSMEALRRLSALKVRVRRCGGEEIIEARELVPGDIVLLAAGDAVAADARLVEASSLEAAEAALTGESLPVEKQCGPLPEDAAPADRTNMVFSGTHIATGRGVAVVVATGLGTEVGKIADLTATAVEPRTPLEQRLARFGRWLVVAAVVLVAVVVAAGLVRGMPFGEVFMVAISQMVSLVPEGLPVAMTIALAVGMQRMAARRAVVRRLAAVETLGSTSVICSDKTGTLTKNEMTVTALWLPGAREIEVGGAGYAPEGRLTEKGADVSPADPQLSALVEASVLCNDAQLLPPDGGESRWRPLGDPTEAALLTLARKAGAEPGELCRRWPRRAEIPFDSAAKLMATEHAGEGGSRVFVKGAPEILLGFCSRARFAGSTAPLDDATRHGAEAAAGAMAARALRVLAVAEVEDAVLDSSGDFAQFRARAIFLGLIGQMDPPRDEAKAAVAECRAAGIRPVMVTGDHKITGLAIARALGVAREGDTAIDGPGLERMSEPDLRAGLDRISVFARVHPAQKLRIVEAFQSRGHVVAMTGDGVNDAPALARADVGVAMGITGTEVAKGAAKIIISDDNFATIVKAVEQGRLVHRNLQKVLLFLFATSVDEVIVLLAALLAGYPLPLAAVQILWINLVTEGTLTVNLIMEPVEGDEMRRPPVPPREGLFSRTMVQRMALLVPASVAATFGFFAWRISTGAPFVAVQTETFTVLAMCQWFNVLNCRSETKSALGSGLVKNPWLLGGLLLAIAMQLLVIYAPPMNGIFHTAPIPLPDFLLVGAVASLVLWVEEIRKLIVRRRAGLSGGAAR